MIIYEKDIYVGAPVVSIIVITYNQKEYLRECLDSIINQVVDFPIEIIIGDDCSIDGTTNICCEYQKKYPKFVKLILNEKNIGLVRNYLSVLSHCNGRYIAQIAGDDYWCDMNKLSIQKSYLDMNANVGLVYTDTYVLNAGKMISNFLSYSIKNFKDHLRTPGYLAPNTWMYRSEYNPNKILTEDAIGYVDESYGYLLDMFQISKVDFIPRYTAVYRQHQGSISFYSSIEKDYIYSKGLFKIKKDYIKKYQFQDQNFIHEIYSNGYLQLIEGALYVNDEEFLNEIASYVNIHGVKYEALKRVAENAIDWRKRHMSVCGSTAYKVGKILIRPFAWIKRMFAR